MSVILIPLFYVASFALEALFYVLIASVILSWLVAFNILNPHSAFVHSVFSVVHGLTDPLLRPIRQRLPAMNGIDLSPMVLILIILFFQKMLSVLAVKLI